MVSLYCISLRYMAVFHYSSSDPLCFKKQTKKEWELLAIHSFMLVPNLG